MNLKWTEEDSRKATLEGWNLYHVEGGSCHGETQIQRNDDQGILEDDTYAWKVVREGKGQHHKKALDILKEKCIPEYNRVMGID